MENKKRDKRVIASKKFLSMSLIEILRTKDVRQITIKEVCERAGVNRTTFYNHYSSIDELYDDIINYIFNEVSIKQERYLKDDLTDTEAMKVFLMSVFEFVEDHRDLFIILLGKNGRTSVGEAFEKYIDTFIHVKQPSAFSRYSVQFVSAGISHILWVWLNEEERIPAIKIVTIISTLFSKGIEQAVMSGLDF